jgi:hypothetical protein
MKFLSSDWVDAARAAIQDHERVRSVARGFDTTIQVSVPNVPSPGGPFNASLFLDVKGGAIARYELSYDEESRLRPSEFRVSCNYGTLVDLAQGNTATGGAHLRRHIKLDGPKLRSYKVRGLLDAIFLATRRVPTEFPDPVTGEPVHWAPPTTVAH